MALTTQITDRIVATYTGTAVTGYATPSFPVDATDTFSLSSGTASGSADKMYVATRTLSASGTEDLDLAGSLTDNLGTSLTIVKLKVLRVTAASTNTNNVQITRPASNGVPLFLAAGDGIPVLPGGMFQWVAPGAGVTVTASTGDLITVTNSSSGTSVTYTVTIIGTSA